MAAKLAIWILKFYKCWISPLLPKACRFNPTCSEYAMEAIERFGIWIGGWLTLRRLMRCHPFQAGGYDPVPKQWKLGKTNQSIANSFLFFVFLSLFWTGVGLSGERIDIPYLLKPPVNQIDAAKELTELQTQLNLKTDNFEEFASLKLREAVLLHKLNRDEDALPVLDEVIKAYQNEVKQKSRQKLPLSEDFHELAVSASYFKAQIISAKEGKNSRSAVKALESVEQLLVGQGNKYSYSVSTDKIVPLWVWDEKAKIVRRYDSAYQVVGKELDFIYKGSLNYQLFNSLVHVCGGNPNYSYGLAVILLALLLRIVMYPLNRKAMQSMLKMQAIQPKMQDLQERYKEDAKKLQAEMMKLYREHKINPLGGCLPLLLQMPVLFWVYYGVSHYRFQFAKSSFLWVDNLAQPDYPLFAVYLVSFFVSTFFTSTPSHDPLQRQQQFLMNILFVVMFAMFFHSFPAAFILYWLSFQVFYMTESFLLKRRYKYSYFPVREVKVNEKGKETKAKETSKPISRGN